MSRLWTLAAQTGAANIYSIVISIATLAITARYLGPAGRGLLAAATTWVTLFATFCSMSLGMVILHRAVGKSREEWLPDLLGTSLAIMAVSVLIGWAVAGMAYAFVGSGLFGNLRGGLILLAFVSLPFLVGTQNGTYIANALGQLPRANLAQVIAATTGLLATAALVGLLGWHVEGALIAVVSGHVMGAVFLWRTILRRTPHFQVRWRTARDLLKGSAQLHLNAIGTYLFANASVLVLNSFRPPEEVGFYQLAIQLFGVTLILPNAIGQVAFGLVAEQNPDRAWTQQRLLLVQALLLTLPLLVIGALLAPVVIPMLAGADFMPAAHLFQLLLPALLGATLSSIMASQWIGRGLFWQASLITLAVGTISIISDFVMVPRYGMYGAVISTWLTYGISVVGNGTMAIWVEQRWRGWRTTVYA